jgi:hypothetical protein
MNDTIGNGLGQPDRRARPRPRPVIELIDRSALNSEYAQSKRAAEIGGDLDDPCFPLAAAAAATATDGGLITDTACRAGLHPGIAEVVRHQLRHATADGGRCADVAATFRRLTRPASAA